MANSGIHIKPSKRGTFTAAAKSRGKTVQGFASAVLANKGNYSPAMVKKANFARNAAKWKKEVGGFLDQQLNETPIDQTLVNGGLVDFENGGYLDLSAPEKKKFDAAAKAMGHTRAQHAAHTFANGGQIQGGGDVTFNPPVTISLKSGQIGEGGTTAEGLGEGIGGAFSSDFDNLTDLASPDVPTEGGLPGIGQLTSQNPGLSEIIPDSLPFQNGGNLPQFATGGWMEPEEAFGLVGDVASAIPVIGTIAGPIIKTVGKVIGKKQAAEKLEHQQDVQARTLDFNSRKRAEAMEEQRTLSQFQFGGGLTDENGDMMNPVINEYNGNSNSHQQGVGGVPVDAKGNPSTVSKQSAVGLTEKGEVTWNGYVFSDKLT